MARKILKAEKELRKAIYYYCQDAKIKRPIGLQLLYYILPLIRAVREDDIQIIEDEMVDGCECRTCEVLKDIIENIRRRK